MIHDSAKPVHYQEKYIDGGLLVRTDSEVVGGARVTLAALQKVTDNEEFPSLCKKQNRQWQGTRPKGKVKTRTLR
jgi:hypothetical protein